METADGLALRNNLAVVGRRMRGCCICGAMLRLYHGVAMWPCGHVAVPRILREGEGPASFPL